MLPFKFKRTPPFFRHSLYFIEYFFARICIFFCRLLTPEQASNFGGWICRTIGPYLPQSEIADRNLLLAMPELSAHERKLKIKKIWEHLGRTICEFPHINQLQENTLKGAGWEITGSNYLTEHAQKHSAVLFVSGHIGNWEMLPTGVAQYGTPFSSFFRAASNPYVNQLILQLRYKAMGKKIPMFAKGATGARQALKYILQGNRLGILSDQKMNDGLEIQFFGQPAMTSSAVASLALRLQCPIIPGYVERLGPARLRIVVEPPIDYTSFNQNNPENIKKLTQVINDTLEKWIRKNPEQWLWLHKRWPKKFYQ